VAVCANGDVACIKQQIAALTAKVFSGGLTAADQTQLKQLQAQLTAATGVKPPIGGDSFQRYHIHDSAIGQVGGVAVIYGYVAADPFDKSGVTDHHIGDDGTYWANPDGTWGAVSHGYSQQVKFPADDLVSNADWAAKSAQGWPLAFMPQGKTTGLPAAFLAAATAKWQQDWVSTTQAIGAAGANAIGGALGLGGLVKTILPQSGVAAQGYKNPPPGGKMPPIPPPPAPPSSSSGPSRALLIAGALVLALVLWRVLA
jgi:hypothetical protein